jgi:hypothetical protein
MSMAVIDDTPAEEGPVKFSPGFRPIVFFRNLGVYLRRRSLLRDQAVLQLRLDLEAATVSLAQALTGLNTLHERLEFHEANIPRMRELRTQFDRGKRAEIERKESSIIEGVREFHEESQRRQLGLLT